MLSSQDNVHVNISTVPTEIANAKSEWVLLLIQN